MSRTRPLSKKHARAMAISGSVGVVGLLLVFLPQINSDGSAWRTTLEVVGVLCALTSCAINVRILAVRLRSAP
jgi:hypothetical protein